METLQLIGSTVGLGFLAGIRLYATAFLLGLAIRYGWFHPGAGASGLLVLAHPAVLTASGIACVLEFIADKVPWVDSLWDSFHTFIRPIGAVLLASAALGNFDPAVKATLMIVCGGVALASTTSKASTRLAVNHSPEPFSNVGLSLAEDALVPVGMWISLRHPAVALGCVAVFLAVFVWLAPRIFRSVRLRWVALRVWLAGDAPIQSRGDAALPVGKLGELGMLAGQCAPMPAAFAKRVQREFSLAEAPVGIRAAATKTIGGMGNSIGYLAVTDQGLAFVTRRWFRQRVHAIPLAHVDAVEWKRGLLMHRLVVRTPEGDKIFRVFRDVRLPEASAKAASTHALAGNY